MMSRGITLTVSVIYIKLFVPVNALEPSVAER